MFQDPIVWLFLFLCFSSTQVAGQRDNRTNGRDRGEKNFNRYVTSVFKVDSLTRIHNIFFELFFFWQVLEGDVEKINNEYIKEDEDAFRTSIEVSLVSSYNLTHNICFK